MAASPGMALTRREALGTTVELVVHPPTGLEAAQVVVDAVLDQLDQAANRFRPDSQLSRLNRAVGRCHQVDTLLAELIAVALDAARSTDGLVDPTLGGPLIKAGYARDFAKMPKDQEACTDTPGIAWGWRHLQLQGDTVVRPPGVLLDLGATAKAWGADRAAAEVVAAVGGSALVSLGGDLTTAGPTPPHGWVVRVTDDHHAASSGLGQNVKLASPALATSSTTQRRWISSGQPMNHIIDPRTGRPTHGSWSTVSVAGPSCVAANTASTAAIVAGPEAPTWLRRRGLPARLVSQAGTALHVGGWPSEGDDLPLFESDGEPRSSPG
ncbi:MAG TPA: FAD:protein FMN transferase [Candidatus Dormibacteraeota bacterium]|nr:FAD:protein FMN transferase [Candidatus Dormibacteraeota bacterium]